MIDGIYARVLSDSGATHSFLSPLFVVKLGRPSSTLSYDLSISAPMGETVRVNVCYADGELTIGGKTFLVDVILLLIRGKYTQGQLGIT